MDYLQSLKNITTAQELIRPIASASIFFEFSDFESFKILFVDNIDDLPELRQKKYQQNLPLAVMYLNDCGEEILFYHDTSISLKYNLTFEHIIQFDPGLKILRQESRLTLADQYASLAALLKK